ncbi:ABC transporter permease [Halostella salina]|uniref:ABC transporter permease n=1 Tax=Halostella salina TaxID=1547897 RepID=UPI000EF80247|nr:ABC transporter permease [Halostella salina]
MNYVFKRLAQAVFTLYAVVTLSFGLIQMLPGGPADYLRAQMRQQGGTRMSAEELNRRIEAQYDVNEPIHQQYIDYMASVLQGDLGESVRHGDVADVLAQAIPWTVFLLATSLFLMFTIGVVLGAFMAYREGSRFDLGSTGLSLVLNSTPYYVVALLLLTFLAYRTGLFPTGGHHASKLEPGLYPGFVLSVLHHAALPIASLVVTGFGGWALNMRGNSIRVLGEDYLRVARLRGLSESRIAIRYVGRNAILPMYTNLMIAIGGVFGGAIILEQIFRYPGVGWYLINAIGQRDYPMMMGTFIIITVAVLLGVVIADLTYGWIDPRAKGGASRESY